ncbi:MAG: zinc ribbon domain-containing protein [Candidatus Altiarchaeota archaeon]
MEKSAIICPKCQEKLHVDSVFCRLCGVRVSDGKLPYEGLVKHSPTEYLNICLLSSFYGGILAGIVGLSIPGVVYLGGVFGFLLGKNKLKQVDAYGRVQYLEGFIIGAMAGLWAGLLNMLLSIIIVPERLALYSQPFGEHGAAFALLIPPLATTFVSMYLTLGLVTVLRRI